MWRILYAIDLKTHTLSFSLGKDSYDDSSNRTDYVINSKYIYYGLSNQIENYDANTGKYSYEYSEAVLMIVNKENGDVISERPIDSPFISTRYDDPYIHFDNTQIAYWFVLALAI